MRPAIHVLTLMLALTACAAAERPKANYPPSVQAMSAERGFAATMADRDHAAFTEFLSEEAVFFVAGEPVRGRAAIAEAWKKYFEGPDAPFSWKPEQVVALDSGTLALSTGPVYGPDGKQIAVFNSVWRKEDDGRWRVIFDKGGSYCPTTADK